MTDDLELLRRFEPVLRFTQGEMFFPMAVDSYLARCSMWLRDSDGRQHRLAGVGEVDTRSLGTIRSGAGTAYLRYVQQPLDLPAYLRWRRDPDRPPFEAVGRWARVGLASRLLDTAFDAGSALRGHVPGGTTAVAEQQYRQDASGSAPVYYGRVVREGGYTVLHYLYFYAMNDFRSSFYGVNDHEADWEQVLVYVVEDPHHPDPQRAVPVWVACAAHDTAGADLRRRWDDPQLERVDDTHPVVFVAAGSHASYFTAGEYLFEVQPRLLDRAVRAGSGLQHVWREVLGQGDEGPRPARRGPRGRLSVPFVDYARGDGEHIGGVGELSESHAGGHEWQWSPVLLLGDEPWLDRYRGLWGLDTRDPWGGERAPAGPKYERDGSLRRSWYDPLGFVGLDEVPAPAAIPDTLRWRLAELQREREHLQQQVDSVRRRVHCDALGRSVEATWRGSGDAATAAASPAPTDGVPGSGMEAGLSRARDELHRLLRHRSTIDDAITATRAAVEAVHHGERPGVGDHLRHPHQPLPPVSRLPWLGELWSATSGGLLILLLGLLPLLGTPNPLLSLSIVLAVVFGLDAVLRGQGVRFALSYTVVMAIISCGVLLVVYWRVVLVSGIALFVLSTIRDNVRELRSLRWRRAIHTTRVRRSGR
ncbi:MAG: hypothetical protein ACRC35_06480 [Angustibacter sp.]